MSTARDGLATHPCAYPPCNLLVSRRVVACPPHWWALPAEVRHEVSVSYRVRTKDPRRHRVALRAALAHYRTTLEV